MFALRAKEYPVFPLCSGCVSILQKRAAPGNSCTGPDHNQRGVTIFRKMEMLRRAWVNRHWNIVGTFGQECRTNSFAHASVTFVLHYINDEVNLIGKRAQTGSDRIKPRLQFGEKSHKFLRAKFYG